MPVFAVEDYEAQEMLASIRDRTVNDSYCGGIEDILPEEISWHNEYIEGELEANLDLNLDGKKYEVYEIPLDVNIIDNEPSFSQYFQDSIIAKGGVGSATIQLWAINTLLEIYKRKCDNNEIFNGKRENINISKKSCQYIVYAYTRLIQDMVVRGINWSTI